MIVYCSTIVIKLGYSKQIAYTCIMRLSELKVNPNNSQIFDDLSKLEMSIEQFPKMFKYRPIVYSTDGVVLGGNKRLICLQCAGFKEIPDSWAVCADDLTEEEKKRFIIEDNVSHGSWDHEVLEAEFSDCDLEAWGVDAEGFTELSEEFREDFELKDGDKELFQQQTYTLADEQAEQIKNAIADIKQTDEYKYCETFGNENSNGNALYLIIMQWAEQKE